MLGLVAGAGVVATDPKKVSAVEVWPRPTTIEDLERFLATTVFLRAHLSPRYSHIAKPLRDLLSVLHEKRAKRRVIGFGKDLKGA